MRMTGLALAFAVLVLSPRGLAATGAADPAPAAAPPTVSAPAMEGEPMAVVGVGGSFRCADFVQAIAAERQGRPPGGDPNHFWTAFFGALMGWADGYVTAKNEDDRLHRLAGSGTNLEQRARWLELFCRANPDAPLPRRGLRPPPAPCRGGPVAGSPLMVRAGGSSELVGIAGCGGDRRVDLAGGEHERVGSAVCRNGLAVLDAAAIMLPGDAERGVGDPVGAAVEFAPVLIRAVPFGATKATKSPSTLLPCRVFPTSAALISGPLRFGPMIAVEWHPASMPGRQEREIGE